MNTKKIVPIRSMVPAKFVMVFNLLLTGAVLVWFTPAAFAGDPVGVCKDSRGCGPSSSSGGGSSDGCPAPCDGGLLGDLLRAIFKPGSSATDQAHQQRLNEAYNANEQAIEFSKKGDLARALALYQEAASKDPDEPVYRQNIAHVQAKLAMRTNQQGLEFYSQRDWAKAIALFQEAANQYPDEPVYRQNIADAQAALANEQAQLRIQQQNRVAANNMQQAIQNFAQTLSAAQSSGGLDFDGRNSGNSPGGGNSGGLDFTSAVATASQARSPSVLPSGDPMVVDTRVPSGLPKSVDNAIAGAYQNAPPGVSDRVRKGFQAVMNRDWKVAKAWFEDALNRDPGNAGLTGLVAAVAGTTPERNRQAAASTAEQRGSLQLTEDDINKVLRLRALVEAMVDGEVLPEVLDNMLSGGSRSR